MENQKIADALKEIAQLLEIKGDSPFRIGAYKRAALAIEKEQGSIEGKKIRGIGPSISEKIEELIKKGRIKYLEDLKKEQEIRIVIAYFFETKGVSLGELKDNAKKRKIVYSRFTKPAKQLIELAGSLEKAKEAILKVSQWAKSRNLDYAIETIFKKWLELDSLKPKEVVKKPFYKNQPMVWSETKKKWYVIDKYGDWLEFAGKESEIEWRIVK